MKRSLMILTPLFMFALAAWAMAQRSVGLDDNRKATMDVDFSGEIDLNWAYHDKTIREMNGGGVNRVRATNTNTIWATAAGFPATGAGGTAPGDGSQGNGSNGGGMWFYDPDGAGAITGGGEATQPAEFFWGRVTLRAVSHLADNVHGFIELETLSHEGGAIRPFASAGAHQHPATAPGHGGTTTNSAVTLEQAYVDLMQVWDPRISFRFGLSDVVVNLRNPSRSGAFFADLTESEAPWHGVQLPAPVTFYDTMEPVGMRFRFEDIHDSNVDFKVWLLPVVSDSTPSANFQNSEQLYMTTVDWYVPGISEPEGESKIQVLLAYMVGGDQGNEIWGLRGGQMALGAAGYGTSVGTGGHNMGVFDFGIGFDVVGVGDPGLELYTELHWQTGVAGKDATGVATSSTLAHRAWAVNSGFRYDALQTQGQPWFEFNFTRRSGDKRLSDGTNNNYLSYENIDDFAIVEGNELGLDVDTGYLAFKLKGGLKFSSAHGSDNIALDLKVGKFNFTTAQPLNFGGAVISRRSRNLGWELDAKLTYWYNDQLSFSTLVGFLTGADAIKNFTSTRDTSTWLLNFGMNFKF